jgi:hypothetical protein
MNQINVQPCLEYNSDFEINFIYSCITFKFIWLQQNIITDEEAVYNFIL